MNTTEIKERLIESIKHVEDEKLLEVLYTILKKASDEEVYRLKEEQIAAIELAREQIKNGQFYTNEEVDQEIEEWLGR